MLTDHKLNMKKVFILAAFLFIAAVAFGQDQIISRGGEVINCKVIKTEGDLVYFDSEVDGAVIRRCIAKSEVHKVRYGIGKEQKFAPMDTTKTEKPDTLYSEAANSLSAQDESKKVKERYHFYIVCGFTLSSYRGSTELLGASEYFNKYYRFFPVTIGGGVSVAVSESVSLQAGVQYVPKGVRFQNNFAWKFGERRTYKTNYFETPVSIQFAPAELKKASGNSYYLKAGIAPSVLITSKIISKGDNYYGGSRDFEGNRKLDLCTILGMGYRIENNYMFEVSYEMGSIDLHNEDIYYHDLAHLYNRSILFTAKYLF